MDVFESAEAYEQRRTPKRRPTQFKTPSTLAPETFPPIKPSGAIPKILSDFEYTNTNTNSSEVPDRGQLQAQQSKNTEAVLLENFVYAELD